MLLALFATLAPAALPMLGPLQDAPPELVAEEPTDEATEMPPELVEIMQAMAAMDWQAGTVMVERGLIAKFGKLIQACSPPCAACSRVRNTASGRSARPSRPESNIMPGDSDRP